jgi:hypothetical protein
MMNRHRCLLVLLPFLLSVWSAPAFSSDAREFENMSRTAFFGLTSEADNAYANKQYDIAFPKYQRLACAGDKTSQAMLGRMYFSGQGVAQNDFQGYLWFKVASEFDFPLYRSTVKKIESVLSADQLKAFAATAEELHTRYGIRATNMSCKEHSSSTFSSNMKDTVICMPKVEGAGFMVHRCLDASPAVPPK